MVGSRFMNYTQCIILSQNLSSMLGGFLIYIFREFLQHCGKIFLIYFDLNTQSKGQSNNNITSIMRFFKETIIKCPFCKPHQNSNSSWQMSEVIKGAIKMARYKKL